MTDTSAVTRAVVLAAGRGSRLGGQEPKPLVPLLGLPLLARTLFTLQKAGVTDAYVVVGYEAERVRNGTERWLRPGLRVHWVHNPDWQEGNGLSVLAAEPMIDGPFFLVMADHVFRSEVVEILAREGAGGGLNLAVDPDVEGVHDLDDATKVQVRDGRIVGIGKELDSYDVIDTGVFLATPALFDALRETTAEGRTSLSAGVERLARDGRARATEVSGKMWQDVDTPADLNVARRKLLEGLRKESDGVVARHLNRPLSIALSSLLAWTPVTPNQMSVSTLVLSILAGVFAAMGGYGNFLLAGLLFHLASVVDGVDGEIAKLKFLSSAKGEWVDTVCDNLGYLAFLAGLVAGVYRAGLPDIYLMTGLLGFATGAGSILNLIGYVAREGESGSFLSVSYGFEDGNGLVSRAFRAVEFMGKRDFLAFLALVLAVVGRLPLALPLFGVGATLLLFPATLQANLASWRRRRSGKASLTSIKAQG